MYRSILFWTVTCTLVLAAGCSSGDGNGDESTEDVGTDVVADVTPDTDSPSDVAREDVRDGGGEADVRSRDVADAEGRDTGEDGVETDPGAAGEPCGRSAGVRRRSVQRPAITATAVFVSPRPMATRTVRDAATARPIATSWVTGWM